MFSFDANSVHWTLPNLLPLHFASVAMASVAEVWRRDPHKAHIDLEVCWVGSKIPHDQWPNKWLPHSLLDWSKSYTPVLSWFGFPDVRLLLPSGSWGYQQHPIQCQFSSSCPMCNRGTAWVVVSGQFVLPLSALVNGVMLSSVVYWVDGRWGYFPRMIDADSRLCYTCPLRRPSQ